MSIHDLAMISTDLGLEETLGTNGRMSSLWASVRRLLSSRSTYLMPLAAATVGQTTDSPNLIRHEKYWLDDGSIIIRSRHNIYKVHRTLLQRHSNLFPAFNIGGDAQKIDGLEVLRIQEELNVDSADVEALLEYLYHDA